MAKNKELTLITVRLDKDCASKLQNLIQDIDCTPSGFVKKAVKFYIETHGVREVVITKKELVRLSA